jgi:hypothetical protein
LRGRRRREKDVSQRREAAKEDKQRSLAKIARIAKEEKKSESLSRSLCNRLLR